MVETEKTQRGGKIKAGRSVEKRERLTRRKRWQIQDEDQAYGAKELDRSVVNPDQIRTVVRTFRDELPEILPGRREAPNIETLGRDIGDQIIVSDVLRRAILERLFSGQLVPQDPSDVAASCLLDKISADRARAANLQHAGLLGGEGRRERPND